MTLSAALFNEVRRRAGFSCEYCGAHENDCGSLLTVDHHRPRSQGGTDDPDNLVYCCQRCNQYKAAYWPTRPKDVPLWSPREEPSEVHFQRLDDGQLKALTEIGQWALKRLRLNRPQLQAYRLRKGQEAELIQRLSDLDELTRSQESTIKQQIVELESQKRLLEVQSEILKALLDDPD